MPLDWATTQNNLGAALSTLGQRESGTEHLDEAVAAYRDALKERTCERVPLDWAQSFDKRRPACGGEQSGAGRIDLPQRNNGCIKCCF